MIEIPIHGPFTMDTIRTFQCGIFTSSRACSAQRDEVKLAFPLDGTFQVVAVALRHAGDRVLGEIHSQTQVEESRVAQQVARILALDVDARPFAAMLARDPVLTRVAAAHEGFRPVVFHSTWAAAGWAVLTQRFPMARAAQLARAIAEASGDTVTVDGEVLASFPRPQSILALDGFRGISQEKWSRLQGAAHAALAGTLDLERLRGLPIDVAREQLMQLRGFGPWTADSVLVRGVGPTDELPLSERLLAEVVRDAYGLARTPSDHELHAMAERWRPFRTWTTILLMMHGMASLTRDRVRARRAA